MNISAAATTARSVAMKMNHTPCRMWPPKGTQPADQAKAERDCLNRYRGLHHLTGTVRHTARERYQDHRQHRQQEDATGTNCGATADARNPNVATATGPGAAGPGPTGTATVGMGTGAPGRPNSCQALTSTQMAVTTRRNQAVGSRTRRTLSHAYAVSDGASAPG